MTKNIVKIKKQYHCLCGHQFEQDVAYSKGNVDEISGLKGKKQAISDQVRCPGCNWLIPTWPKIKIGDKWVRIRR